jgi:hypothetical protein
MVPIGMCMERKTKKFDALDRFATDKAGMVKFL